MSRFGVSSPRPNWPAVCTRTGAGLPHSVEVMTSLCFDRSGVLDPPIEDAAPLSRVIRDAIQNLPHGRAVACPPKLSSSLAHEHRVGDMDKSFRENTNTLHRLRTWLRSRYPQHTAKLVARDIEADPRTVENWISSDPQPPIWRHWEAMMEVYGPAFRNAVFAPQRRRDLHARLDALETTIRELREAL